MLDEYLNEPRTEYFSMETALRSEMPACAGGLGRRMDRRAQDD